MNTTENEDTPRQVDGASESDGRPGHIVATAHYMDGSQAYALEPDEDADPDWEFKAEALLCGQRVEIHPLGTAKAMADATKWRHDEPDPEQHQAIEVFVPGGVMLLWSRAGRWANLGMHGQCLADYHGGTVAERGWRPAVQA